MAAHIVVSRNLLYEDLDLQHFVRNGYFKNTHNCLTIHQKVKQNVFEVISKKAVGYSWDIFNAILGHKYQNHSDI